MAIARTLQIGQKGDTQVSIPQEIEQLRQLASHDAIPIGLLNQANEVIAALPGKVVAIVGEQSQHVGGIEQGCAEVQQAISGVMEMCKAVEEMIYNASDAHGRG